MDNKYVTGYSGMEYIIYDKPIRMNKKDAWIEYNEGGVLFYEWHISNIKKIGHLIDIDTIMKEMDILVRFCTVMQNF